MFDGLVFFALYFRSVNCKLLAIMTQQLVKFRKGSKLYKILDDVKNNDVIDFKALYDKLTDLCLQKIDPINNNIIISDYKLKEIIGIEVFHISQISDIIKNNTILYEPNSLEETYSANKIDYIKESNLSEYELEINPSYACLLNINNGILKAKEVLDAIMKYLSKNKKTHTSTIKADDGNIFYIGKDQLGKFFGLDYIHKTQIVNIILKLSNYTGKKDSQRETNSYQHEMNEKGILPQNLGFEYSSQFYQDVLKFKKSSKLGALIFKKEKIQLETFTYRDLWLVLKEIMLSEDMFEKLTHNLEISVNWRCFHNISHES